MKLTINMLEVDVPEDLGSATLLDVLRDHLALTGTKFGCGIGLCGACTVHVDGQAQRSCQLHMADLAGTFVTTIEGLAASRSNTGELHPVQQAWIEEAVPQCGYCQAGQIMNAASLLEDNPAPSLDDIKLAMDGNICRCGTYARIRKAILRASKEMQHG